MARPKNKDHFQIDANQIPEELLINDAPFGAGRKPKALQLQKYEHVLKRLDDKIDEVMDTLFALLVDPDPNIRLRVAEMLLKKYLPDKKVKEVTGANGGPVQITQHTDIRAIVLTAADVLDGLTIDEVTRRAENGNFRIIETIPRGEGEA